MGDRRAIGVLVVFVLFIGGIVSYRSTGSSTSEPTPVAPLASTSTTEVPLLNSTPQTAADFTRIVEDMTRLENTLFADPDAGRVGELMEVDCSCHGDTRERLSNLERNRWRVSGDGLVLQRASLLTVSDDTMEGVVQLDSGGGRTVDSTGETIEESPTGPFQPLVYTLKKSQNGVWRILDRRLPEEVF